MSLGAPGAVAFPQVGAPGEGAGQISKPHGVAVDTETGRLYVADAGNFRVDAFDAETGGFELAFGWGVRDGANELQTCGPKATPPSAECRKGKAGSGGGQFTNPTSIAVDNEVASASHHDVYVFDSNGESSRVEKFSPDGGFLLEFGEAGKGECQLAAETDGQHPLAIGPGGTVYVGNVSFIGSGESNGFKVRAEKFQPSGVCIETVQLAEFLAGEYSGAGAPRAGGGLAVTPTGKIYATFFAHSGPLTRKFDPAGNPLGTVGLCAGATALGLDPADNLFIGCGETIEEVDASGNELRVFGYGSFLSPNIGGLAAYHSASGELFASESNSGADNQGRIVYLPFPAPGPLVLPNPEAAPIGNTKATLNAEVNPEGKEAKYHFQYITEADFQKNLGEGHEGFLGATRAPGSAGEDQSAGEDFKVHQVSLQVGCAEPTQQLVSEGKCLQPETKYHFRVLAESSDGEGNSPVEGEAFKTKEPIEIIAEWASEVGAEAATLNAEVNPFGIPASGHFEYITEADFQKNLGEGHKGFAGASETAVIDLGSGEVPTIGSATAGPLEAATTYRFRLVASDLFVSEKAGPAQSFRTFAAGGKAPLADTRNYEMVSPTAKNSGEVGVPMPSGGSAFLSVEPQQAATDGAKMTYGSFTAFGPHPESAPATSQYLSALGPPFWTSANIDPRFEEGYARDPLVGFSADLAHAAMITVEPPLTLEATPGFPNLYVRDNLTGALTAVTTSAHVPKVESESAYCLYYGGASADFGRVIFAALGALNEGDPAGDGFNLYEWSAGEGIKLVSRLPNGKAATPKEHTAFGAAGNALTRTCGVATQLMRHAISTDGSRIFWTLEGSFQGAANPLLARVGGAETLRLDEPNKEAGVSGAGGKGKYWDASGDGAEVFFSDEEKLTADATPAKSSPDLYRYDFQAPLHKRLSDLTANGGEAANVLGVLGASEDGSYVYFVATGVLSEAPNSQGAVAVAGADNLYAWHEGQTRFLAGLGGEDASDWAIDPTVQSARVTAGGGHLAFLSTNSLSGYDNTIGEGSHCQLESLEKATLVGSAKCAEVYLYDFEANDLSCASCNPSGARPLGPARLPGWSTPYLQPRYLSEDGRRLFFDTLDSLNPRDSNEKRDVYEFERPGTGSCSEESPTFSAASGGCLYLISSGESSGQSTDESYLLDASANGDGVFFSTRQSLLFTDKDEHFDVYDARVGGQAPAPEPVICEGSCPNGGTGAEEPPPAASAGFQAPAEKPSLECQKGTRKVRRKGKERCVKAKKHNAPHKTHRASR
jgi:hypothetical protein